MKSNTSDTLTLTILLWDSYMNKLCSHILCNTQVNIYCSCTIFLAQILLIRPWPKAQPTINIRRGWVKELSLSESIRSDTWTALLQKNKNTRMDFSVYFYFFSSSYSIFSSPSLRDLITLYSSPSLISALHLLII